MAHFESGRGWLVQAHPFPTLCLTRPSVNARVLVKRGYRERWFSARTVGEGPVGVAIRRMPPAASVGGQAIAFTTFYNSLLRLDTSTLPELYISGMA
jgi:hypothetical protein